MPTKTRTAKSSTPDGWAASGAAWKKRGGPHRITLPSGQRVLARVLGLASMAALDGLPRDLSDAVLLHVANLEAGGLPAVIGAELAQADAGDDDAAERADRHVQEFLALTKHLVAAALVEPQLTPDELSDVPEQDLEFLMRIVTARQAYDAEGVRIGVEPVDAWATFRHEHGCAEDCQACGQALRRLSSLQLDDGDV